MMPYKYNITMFLLGENPGDMKEGNPRIVQRSDKFFIFLVAVAVPVGWT